MHCLGVLTYDALVLWYVIAMFIFLVNSLRTLSAHAYRNPGDQPMEFYEQYLDSINVPGNFLTGLWAPVGLRYHATHHLFMSLPYHNLGEAQRRLVNGLSDNRLYLSTIRGRGCGTRCGVSGARPQRIAAKLMRPLAPRHQILRLLWKRRLPGRETQGNLSIESGTAS